MPRRSELRISKRTVGALTVGEKDTVFWDRDLAGFGVRVHATGRKTYVVQSRDPSGPKRVTLGLHGDLSADEVRKQAAVVIDRIKRGEDSLPLVPETELTVAALAERFTRVHVDVHCKPSTIATYRSVLERHIMPVLGGMALSAVGRREIAALHHRQRRAACLLIPRRPLVRGPAARERSRFSARCASFIATVAASSGTTAASRNADSNASRFASQRALSPLGK